MGKKIFTKPAPGCIHVHMGTLHAKSTLLKLGPHLASALSKYMDNAKVSHRVSVCPSRPRYYKITFEVPVWAKIPEGVMRNILEKRRIACLLTFPLDALDTAVSGYSKRFHTFFESSMVDMRGNILLRFIGAEDNVAEMHEVATSMNLQIREIGKHRHGTPRKGLYIVVPLQHMDSKKAGKPRLKKVKKAGHNKFTPEAVYKFVWNGFMLLDESSRLNLVSSMMSTLSDVDRVNIINDVLPEGYFLKSEPVMTKE